MNEPNLTRLSEVVDVSAPPGANDARWFLVEHQLAQVRMSAQLALITLGEIKSRPENAREGQVADDCETMVHEMYVDFLEYYSAFLSYLSNSDVPGRVGRKEL